MVTFVFPGQGSQSKGMGGELFDEFKDLTTKADEILGYSIKELCLEDPLENLNQTQYTQPALYIVNALSYIKRINETGKKPDFVMGHSLGEYNALFAAGAFDFETGLKLVKKRGELMAQADGGGMAAVIGISEEKVADVIKENNLSTIDIANYNSPYQIVISGPKADIDNAKAIFESVKDVHMYVILKTSGAFHSRCMEAAKREFEIFLQDFNLSKLSIPVISNIHARPYKQNSIKNNIAEQITSAVKWTESVRYLMGIGEMEFVELGHGKVLAGLIHRIKREAQPLVIEKEELDTDFEDYNKDAAEEDNNIEADNEYTRDSAEGHYEEQHILHTSLGSHEFMKEYKLKYAYLTGGMYRGISSTDMVVKLGKAGMMGFFGTSGVKLTQVEDAIKNIQSELCAGQAYGMNLVHNYIDAEAEEKLVELFLKYQVKAIEASGFLEITPALVRYHAKGLKKDKEGNILSTNKIIAKVTRPELIQEFLSPAPEWILDTLIKENKITPMEAELSRLFPIADAICAEADSAGNTDIRSPYALIPTAVRLRNEMIEKYKYSSNVYVGAAGGIGTPEAALAAFVLGADFILTGSINQCTVEAATSDAVKDMLQQINIQDTEYTISGELFELGLKAQVLKKGLFFPTRGNRLYELYRQYNSLNEIDEKSKKLIQSKYLKRSFEEVYDEVKKHLTVEAMKRADQDAKYKMALVFKWYFEHGTQLAISGNDEGKVDYHIPCSSALGAFNQWIKETKLESWRNRHVDELGKMIMKEAEKLLTNGQKGSLPLI